MLVVCPVSDSSAGILAVTCVVLHTYESTQVLLGESHSNTCIYLLLRCQMMTAVRQVGMVTQ